MTNDRSRGGLPLDSVWNGSDYRKLARTSKGLVLLNPVGLTGPKHLWQLGDFRIIPEFSCRTRLTPGDVAVCVRYETYDDCRNLNLMQRLDTSAGSLPGLMKLIRGLFSPQPL